MTPTFGAPLVLVIGIESIKARSGSGVIEISPVRLRGLGWSSLQLDLQAGIMGTGSTSTTVSCDHPFCGDDPLVDEPIDTTGLPEVDAGFVRGAIRVGTPRRHAGAGYGRSLRPTLGVELALEDRLSIWTSGSVGRLGGELRAWGGKTRLWLDQDTEDEAYTWGIEGAFDARARPGLHLGLTSQLGRSFYAVAGDEPRPEFGWRLFATASYEWSDRRALRSAQGAQPPAKR